MNNVEIGTQLPELLFPITASAIAVAAIATNDYQNVHHDKAAATSTGVPDIFMNILSTNGIVQRFVNDWAGPKARIKKIKLRLGAPNFVGDAMTLSGSVTNIDPATGAADIAVTGRNRIGEHVNATVTIILPGADQ
jgi:acyl dehydratase